MSVSLHRIFDRLQSGQLQHWGVARVEDVDNAGAILRRRGKSAQCFDIGDAMSVDDFKVITELVRLPFSTCWFEWDLGIERWGALVFEDECNVPIPEVIDQACRGRTLSLFLWVSVPNQAEGEFGFVGVTMVTLLHAGAIAGNPKADMVLRFDPAAGLKQDEAEFACTVICKFLSALHCKNISRLEHKPDSARQKRRAKQGRAALFSYWTLHVELSRGTTERADKGGTHASPRVHLRRGHPREYKPGEWTWVQPHVVGNKELGMVHKDYAVKGNK